MMDTSANPFLQRLLAQNPGLASQLQPGLPVAPAPALTADAVRQIVDERLAAAMPQQAALQRLAGVSAQFDAVFQKALSAEDYAALQKYVADGAPGFADMVSGGKLSPIAQLLWETIKENKA